MSEQNTRSDHMVADRRAKLEALRGRGIDPFPAVVTRAERIEQLRAAGNDVQASVAGRLIAVREHGKTIFADLADESGCIQLSWKADELPAEEFALVKLLDPGDFLAVQGTTFTTKMGELTVLVTSHQVLAKALRPAPRSWQEFANIEERYRNRPIDLLAHPAVKQVFAQRSKIIQAIRAFLDDHDFIEVDTPILQPLYGGGAARPFVSQLNDLDMKVYLAIAKELYLKRLVVGGFERVYEMNRVFRNEGIDATHNPEFTMLETMWAFVDYHANMDLFEELVESVANRVLGTTRITYQGTDIELGRPWKRCSMRDALKEFADLDVDDLSDTALQDVLGKQHLKLDGEYRRGLAIEAIFSHLVEPQLIQPTIVYNYPADTSPFAKRMAGQPDWVERFEPYIYGWEMGNNYTELNDPDELKRVFREQAEFQQRGDEEAAPYDEDFVQALEYGMPPTSGLGLGVDRLIMLLTNAASIKDVVFFPFMKPRGGQSQPEAGDHA
ncbi:lysine--tRNA ligase [Candidatus Berkelbacteria bacterium]|nr:lysine--tRNA ligase [Candidatus Berkelbacteria bacterium]